MRCDVLIAWSTAGAIVIASACVAFAPRALMHESIAADDLAMLVADGPSAPLPGQNATPSREAPKPARRRAPPALDPVPTLQVAAQATDPVAIARPASALDRTDPWSSEERPAALRPVAKLDRQDPWTGGTL